MEQEKVNNIWKSYCVKIACNNEVYSLVYVVAKHFKGFYKGFGSRIL